MIDLHIHTTHSDGQYNVIELLKMAQDSNINTISFCDHNVISAYLELQNIDVKKYYKGNIITGIEFNCKYKNNIYHVLGYNYDINKLKKSKYINNKTKEEIITSEEKKLTYLKEVCASMNIKLSNDIHIKSSNEIANDIIKNDMQLYKDNNEILDKILGKDRNKSFFFNHIMNPESPFYIDLTNDLPTLSEIVDEIHNSGGIAIIAHIFEYKYNSINNITLLNEIKDIIDGVECVYSRFNEKQTKYLINFCKKNNLIMSGGSDYHTANKQKLGKSLYGFIEDEFCLKK